MPRQPSRAAALILAAALGLAAAPAAAQGTTTRQSDDDCRYQDLWYPPGTRLGHLVCQNGRWVPG